MPRAKKYTASSVQLDEADRWILSSYPWTITQCGKKRYVRLTVGCEKIYLHRFLTGARLKEHQVDHEDLDGLNNRRDNLRVCTKSQNMMNRELQANNTSGYKGVTFDKHRGLWRASIKVNNKAIHLGRFSDKAEAAEVYNIAAILYHAGFARFN